MQKIRWNWKRINSLIHRIFIRSFIYLHDCLQTFKNVQNNSWLYLRWIWYRTKLITNNPWKQNYGVYEHKINHSRTDNPLWEFQSGAEFAQTRHIIIITLTKLHGIYPDSYSLRVELKNLQQVCLYITDFKCHKMFWRVGWKKLWGRKDWSQASQIKEVKNTWVGRKNS